MNIIGEYTIQYNIYTMFDVYEVKIKNHNLITSKGYEFFLTKWYKNTVYPVQLGYYNDNAFYERKTISGGYSYDLKNYNGGSYSKSTIYIDKDTYYQYIFDGENFIDYSEKLEKICIGDDSYTTGLEPHKDDIELNSPTEEYIVNTKDFVLTSYGIIMKCTINKEELDGTTEVGVKTNHGRLVSHDIHAPYYLPYGNEITLEYVFKLDIGE